MFLYNGLLFEKYLLLTIYSLNMTTNLIQLSFSYRKINKQILCNLKFPIIVYLVTWFERASTPSHVTILET